MISDSKLNFLHVSFFRLNQFCLFVWKESCQLSHLDAAPPFLMCIVSAILHTIHSLSQLSRSFWATDEDDATNCSFWVFFFCFWCFGYVTVLLSQWDPSKKKKIVIKEKLFRPLLWWQSFDSLKDEFLQSLKKLDQSRPTTTSNQTAFDLENQL